VGGSSFCIYSLFFAPLACVSKLMIAPFGRVASEVFYFSNEEKKDKDVIVFSPFFHYTVIFYDNYLVHKKLWLDGIKKRIDIFFLEGWLEEIRGLSDSWRSLLMQKKFIGYNELIPFVDFKNGF
jgi:tRNA A37 N6-isopentenylltransferase MiaA